MNLCYINDFQGSCKFFSSWFCMSFIRCNIFSSSLYASSFDVCLKHWDPSSLAPGNNKPHAHTEQTRFFSIVGLANQGPYHGITLNESYEMYANKPGKLISHTLLSHSVNRSGICSSRLKRWPRIEDNFCAIAAPCLKEALTVVNFVTLSGDDRINRIKL